LSSPKGTHSFGRSFTFLTSLMLGGTDKSKTPNSKVLFFF